MIVAALEDVSVRRGRRMLLKHIHLRLPAGRLSVVIGPNGSGKSTIARIIAGQAWPSDGRALLGGSEGLAPAGTVQTLVRLVQSSSPLDFDPHLTAGQIVLTGFYNSLALYHTPTAQMRRRAATLLAALGLELVADSPYGVMSTGEKVRMLIARAMAVRPAMLILDEPTSGLDLLARERVLASIRRILRHSRRTAILLITHHVEEVLPETHQVMVLAEGRAVASGPPNEVLCSRVLSGAYGVNVDVHRHHGRYYTTVHADAWRSI